MFETLVNSKMLPILKRKLDITTAKIVVFQFFWMEIKEIGQSRPKYEGKGIFLKKACQLMHCPQSLVLLVRRLVALFLPMILNSKGIFPRVKGQPPDSFNLNFQDSLTKTHHLLRWFKIYQTKCWKKTWCDIDIGRILVFFSFSKLQGTFVRLRILTKTKWQLWYFYTTRNEPLNRVSW